MLYELVRLKFNDDKTVDIPDGCIPLSHMVDPKDPLLDMAECREHGWEMFLFVLKPVKS